MDSVRLSCRIDPWTWDSIQTIQRETNQPLRKVVEQAIFWYLMDIEAAGGKTRQEESKNEKV
jgi:hypothetical protein